MPTSRLRCACDRPARLLANGVLMSASFAGLEGCVVACIVISAAIVPPEVAHQANGCLYLSFAVGTFAAPGLLSCTGAKLGMVLSMLAYSLYTAAFLMPRAEAILPAAAFGGFAGALLWTAQGEYFTANALAYASARAAADERRASAAHAAPSSPAKAAVEAPRLSQQAPADAAAPPERGRGGSGAIELFAGLFATLFPLFLLLGKLSGSLLLSLRPCEPELLFCLYTAVALVCTAAMACVRSLPFAEAEEAETPRATPATAPAATSPSPTPAHEIQLEIELTTADGKSVALSSPPTAPTPTAPTAPPRAAPACACPSVAATLCERRLALLTPTNCAFGAVTALYPAKVTLLVKHLHGAAATLLLYSLSGLASAVFAALLSLIARRCAHGRAAAVGLGAAGFALACGCVAACDPAGEEAVHAAAASATRAAALRNLSCAAAAADEDGALAAQAAAAAAAAHEGGCALLASWPALLGAFGAYGLGVASWQGPTMALVGDVFRAAPRPAFAHLKLTSGVTSAVGFWLLPRLSLRAAALACLGVVAVGAATFARLSWVLHATPPFAAPARAAAAGGGRRLLPAGATSSTARVAPGGSADAATASARRVP